jgi:ribose 5-phosphate isomerase A
MSANRHPRRVRPRAGAPGRERIISNTEAGAEALKRVAAARALERVRDGMALGLGTGSTVAHFLSLLGEEVRAGRLYGIRGVPTSERTASAAKLHEIPLATLEEEPVLDLTVDGADEVDPGLNLVKGLGGALLREKIVARASRRFIVIVDESKVVPRLGTRAPLPVEVVPFGWTTHLPWFRALGARAERRDVSRKEPYRTDNGNFILDVHFPGGILDPFKLEIGLQARAGIVESGLFLDMAEEVIVAGGGDVRSMTRETGA